MNLDVSNQRTVVHLDWRSNDCLPSAVFKESILPALCLDAFSIITYLNLAGNGLGDEGVAELFARVPGSSMITIELYFNQITAVGAKSIVDHVLGPDFDLALESSQLFRPKSASDLRNSRCVLQHLRLGWNDLEDEGAQAICNLFYHPLLIELNLCYNDIGPVGGEIIRDTVKHSVSLRRLPLHGNSVPQPVIDSIEAVLLYNDKQHVE